MSSTNMPQIRRRARQAMNNLALLTFKFQKSTLRRDRHFTSLQSPATPPDPSSATESSGWRAMGPKVQFEGST